MPFVHPKKKLLLSSKSIVQVSKKKIKTQHLEVTELNVYKQMIYLLITRLISILNYVGIVSIIVYICITGI